MALKIQPLADRVVVEPQAAETKLLPGFISPIPLRKNPNKARSLPWEKEKKTTT